MKKEKIITMVCPACKASYEPVPTVIIEKDGGTHIEYTLRRRCKVCRTGLIRKA